jgi:molybdopterin synthase sulfur carrier subunit
LIKHIDQRFPGVKDRIREADVKVRRFANIFVNEEDIRILENRQNEVSVIPAIAG